MIGLHQKQGLEIAAGLPGQIPSQDTALARMSDPLRQGAQFQKELQQNFRQEEQSRLKRQSEQEKNIQSQQEKFDRERQADTIERKKQDQTLQGHKQGTVKNKKSEQADQAMSETVSSDQKDSELKHKPSEKSKTAKKSNLTDSNEDRSDQLVTASQLLTFKNETLVNKLEKASTHKTFESHVDRRNTIQRIQELLHEGNKGSDMELSGTELTELTELADKMLTSESENKVKKTIQNQMPARQKNQKQSGKNPDADVMDRPVPAESLATQSATQAKWEIQDNRAEKSKTDVAVETVESSDLESEAQMNSNANESNSQKGKPDKQLPKQIKLENISDNKSVEFDQQSAFEQIQNDSKSGEISARTREAFDKLIQKAKVNIRRDGSSHTTIRLNPKLLGSMTLHIHLDQNVMQGQVIVDNNAAFKLVKEELEFMKQELKSQGIQVESLQIKVREASGASLQFQDARDEHSLENKFQSDADSNKGHNQDSNEPSMQDLANDVWISDTDSDVEYGEQTITRQMAGAIDISI